MTSKLNQWLPNPTVVTDPSNWAIWIWSHARVGTFQSKHCKRVIPGITAKDSYVFLLNWLERFPQYKIRDLFITGESYAGHYVTQLASYILSRNKGTNQTIINLKGIAIGNAWIDDDICTKGLFVYLWTHALNSDETNEGINKYCDFASENLVTKMGGVGNTEDQCDKYQNQGLMEMGDIDLYGIYAPICNPSAIKPGSNGNVLNFYPCSGIHVESYLNLAEVQAALHAKATKCDVGWTDSPSYTLPQIRELALAKVIRVWIYSGDTDGRVPVTSSRFAIKTLQLPVETAWQPWYSASEFGELDTRFQATSLQEYYQSVAEAASEVTWISSLLGELGVKNRIPSVIWCDNTSVVALSTNPVYHAQSKHVDMEVHFVREKVEAKQLQVNYVPACNQVADGLTKSLTKGAFEACVVELIWLCELTTCFCFRCLTRVLTMSVDQLASSMEGVLLTVRSHRLERLLTGSMTAPSQTVDSAFAPWLLSTISPQLLPQFVGAETSSAVWSTVLQFFSNRSTTAVISLHYKLQSLKKGDESMRVYLTRVKEVCDALASYGSAVSQAVHVASILKGLPREYQPFVAVITTMRFCDPLESLPMSAHMVQGQVSSKTVDPSDRNTVSSQMYSRGRSTGRGRVRSRSQCQLCGKNGHLIDQCWHRFDEDFPGVTTNSNNYSKAESGNAYYAAKDNSYDCNTSKKSGAHQLKSQVAREHWVVDSGATHHLARDNNVFLEFHAHECCVRDEKTGSILLRGKEDGGLYSFVVSSTPEDNSKAENYSTQLSTAVYDLWHHRLGYPSHDSLLKLVFTDLWGPSHVASTGYKYYVTFVDACTRHSWLYLLKDKAQAISAFEMFQQMVKNGVVECKHRHVIELALVLLAQASMLVKFWAYAVVTVVHLINRLPTRVLHGASLFEKLFHQKPAYEQLRVFGCLCFPHLRPYLKHILDFRSKPCTFLGYSTPHKGFQCLADDGRIYITRHVVFDESQFPFAKKCAQLPAATSTTNKPSGSIEIVTDVSRLQGERCTTGSQHNLLDNANDDSSSLPVASSGHRVETADNVSSAEQQLSSDFSVTGQNTSNTEQVEVVSTYDETQELNTTEEGAENLSDAQVNSHPMMTKSKCGIFRPKVFTSNAVSEVPNNVYEALNNSSWREAVQAERPDGTVERHKARLVAKGYSQVPGCDFKETYSPVVKFATLNTVLSIVVTRNWPLRQIDVNNAFLNGDLTEDVFMQQPPRFEEYAADGSLMMGFSESRADVSLFVKNNGGCFTYILVYVDDIILTGGSSHVIDEVVRTLNLQFSLKDLGELSYFLGIEVTRKNESLVLSQRKYIIELLEKTNLLGATPTATPMIGAPKLTQDAGELLTNAREYRSIVGALLYVCYTRPDVAFSVNKTAQYMHAPRELHMAAVKRILRYLAGTLDYGLTFTGASNALDVTAFADADWGGNLDDRRSISGHVVYVGACPVVWCSRKQKTVSRSTIEAEYRSVAKAASEVTWINSLLGELGVKNRIPSVIWCDNTSVVALSTNPMYHAQSKHVDMDVHFVREKVEAKQLQVNYVPACNQVEDGLTKSLTKGAFEVFRDQLCVLPYR
ncbi:hypothetical protein F3Y22_tig00111718pilonHSYRG00018 [Hibiscus syriacus]|uniref:Ig-like domain-containing protein n=1 Tax=Hibiscus syriacus TaxID=106335 RepID=A0A6A2XG68_HIBSY|nr:hypothetical protein F3Y22_tig00111718pilonHSYRG00018 [Hibiscus syriacus]